MNNNDIEAKYGILVDKAKFYMKNTDDFEHDINHMKDVVNYTKELLNIINIDVNRDVCIISAYWHDVGRTKCNDGHEKVSAEMLKKEMIMQGYDRNLIDKCYKAIEKHKWNMQPDTVEGLIVRDADKLGFIGKYRWEVCLKNNKNLNEIISLLPKLKSEILYFEESKKIYDRDITKLVEKIYKSYLIK